MEMQEIKAYYINKLGLGQAYENCPLPSLLSIASVAFNVAPLQDIYQSAAQKIHDFMMQVPEHNGIRACHNYKTRYVYHSNGLFYDISHGSMFRGRDLTERFYGGYPRHRLILPGWTPAQESQQEPEKVTKHNHKLVLNILISRCPNFPFLWTLQIAAKLGSHFTPYHKLPLSSKLLVDLDEAKLVEAAKFYSDYCLTIVRKYDSERWGWTPQHFDEGCPLPHELIEILRYATVPHERTCKKGCTDHGMLVFPGKYANYDDFCLKFLQDELGSFIQYNFGCGANNFFFSPLLPEEIDVFSDMIQEIIADGYGHQYKVTQHFNFKIFQKYADSLMKTKSQEVRCLADHKSDRWKLFCASLDAALATEDVSLRKVFSTLGILKPRTKKPTLTHFCQVCHDKYNIVGES